MTLRTFFTWIGLCLSLLGAALASSCSRAPVVAEGSVAFDPHYRDWNTVLLTNVSAEGTDYASLAASPEPLDQALSGMASVGPETFRCWPRAERLSFLINAHNAYAMARVVRHYPTGSLSATSCLLPARSRRDITLLGKRWSLQLLADEIMSNRYQDSRMIFLLNWAEQGCAPLPPVAVTGRNLDYLADRQVRRCLADADRQQYDTSKKMIRLTPLVKTYRKELERDYTTLWGFLERFLPSEPAGQIKKTRPRIRYLAFDRSLNQWPEPVVLSVEDVANAAARQAETRMAIEQTKEAFDLLGEYESTLPVPVQPSAR